MSLRSVDDPIFGAREEPLTLQVPAAMVEAITQEVHTRVMDTLGPLLLERSFSVKEAAAETRRSPSWFYNIAIPGELVETVDGEKPYRIPMREVLRLKGVRV